MHFFTIAEVAHLSGINAHTIRIWEKRYSITQPERSSGNIRKYTVDDLDRILKLTVLTRAGYKISRVARLDPSSIDAKLEGLVFEDDRRCHQMFRLIIGMFTMETVGFEAGLNKSISESGLEKTIDQIILPFLEKTKLYSCRNCSAAVDFAVAILRKKLILGIENLPASLSGNKTALLFLPRGEHYDLLLLYYCYLLKSNGLNVLYMGTNVSLEKIKMVVAVKNPDFLLTYVPAEHKHKMIDLQYSLASETLHATLLVAGTESSAQHEHAHTNFRVMHYTELLSSVMAATA